MNDCPDPGLCERVGFHVHGRVYRLYRADERYRRKLDGLPPRPSLLRKALNLAGALVRHAADGLARVGDDEYAARLVICDHCEQKEGTTCRACGCVLALKASWRSEGCPLGKWPGERPRGGCGCGSPEQGQPAQPEGEAGPHVPAEGVEAKPEAVRQEKVEAGDREHPQVA